jgi:lysophospholipase L1-like esterase
VEDALQEVGAQLADTTNRMPRCNLFAHIGDSITNGNLGYPYYAYLLQKGVNLTKYATGGYTIANAISTLVPLMLAATQLPTHAIFLIGINDIMTSRTQEQMQADYTTMIEMAVSRKITPIICGLIGSDTHKANILLFNDWLMDYAHSNGFVYIDTYTPFVDADGDVETGYLQDSVHPTSLGSYVLANTVYDKLPLLSTDRPSVIPGGENLLLNPNFITDTDADGLADSWAYTGSGATGTFALVDHPLLGKWQQINITGGSSESSFVWARQSSITAGYSAGDTLELSLDVYGEDGLTPSVRVKPAIFCRQGTTTLSTTYFMNLGESGVIEMPKTGEAATFSLVYTWQRILNTFVVPANTDNIQVALWLAGTGTGSARFGRAVLKHV